MSNHNKPVRTIESFALKTMPVGFTFYSPKEDKDITAIASYYRRRVLTERIITVSGYGNPVAGRLTKVIIIE